MTRARSRAVALALALALGTLATYAGVRELDFVRFDDDLYVTGNPRVQEGLSVTGVRWALAATDVSNWHPLTWLSHMLDCELFGLEPAAHHGVSALLHAVNAALLFAVLVYLTGAAAPSALAAAIFALHPLQVESVAWIAERKNLLCTGFALLALLTFAAWTRRRRWPLYAASVVLFALGLLAKPMIVTLPFCLLLVDWWPLGRARSPIERLGPRALEKLPFFALAAASSAVTLLVQQAAGSVYEGPALSLALRAQNAVVAYARYLVALFWPLELAPLYPHPLAWPATVVGGALTLLVAVSWIALLQARRRPYLLFGWLWFAGGLVPTSGLVQVGVQSMADRYVYFPLIGLACALAWSAADVGAALRSGVARATAAGLVALALAACAVLTRAQVERWSDTGTLFQHTIAVTRENWFAHNQYGAVLAERGDLEQAIPQLREALRINPASARARYNLGRALHLQGQRGLAIVHYREAIAIAPGFAPPHLMLGLALGQEGEIEGSLAPLGEAVRLEPGNGLGRFLLASALEGLGRSAAAETELRALLARSPDHSQGLSLLGVALAHQERLDEARTVLAQACEVDPTSWEPRFNLGLVEERRGDPAAARDHYRAALELAPASPAIAYRLAWLLATTPAASLRDGAEAVRLAERACQKTCSEPADLDVLAAAYAEAGRFAEASRAGERAAAAARERGDRELSRTLAARARLYRERRPYREP